MGGPRIHESQIPKLVLVQPGVGWNHNSCTGETAGRTRGSFHGTEYHSQTADLLCNHGYYVDGVTETVLHE